MSIKNYECDGQFSMFSQEELLRYEHCTGCTNANYKETTSDGNKLFYCAKHRTYITEITRPSFVIGCKGKDFKRRGNE